VRLLSSELALHAGSIEKIRSLCFELGDTLGCSTSPDDLEQLRTLARSVRTTTGGKAIPVADLLAAVARSCPAPWTLLAELLQARERRVAHRALELAAELAASGRLADDPAVAGLFAKLLETEGSPFADRESLEAIAGVVRRTSSSADGDPLVTDLLDSRDQRVRRLAARLLDLDHEPAPDEVARRMLGDAAYASLLPYLTYTRARHEDLLSLVATGGTGPPAEAAIRCAEQVCGGELLRQVVSDLGWSRLALGLEVRHLVGISIAGSLPLAVTPTEASLLRACSGEARQAGEWMLFIAHGGTVSEDDDHSEITGSVGRFRTLNILHSELLELILDVAPLTAARVGLIVTAMDRIVDDFKTLFTGLSADAAILDDVYGELRGRIMGGIRNQPTEGAPVSPEVTRLATSFEDPANLGDVRTLHGLKRYLHQKGLNLGSRLAGARSGPQHHVDLVLASRGETQTIRRIRYTDFEGTNRPGRCGFSIPFPVREVVEGSARQLLGGQTRFPDVDIFCYGNEVHYFLAFRNHPAFVRIDFSPPLRGGMVDLDFFGISAYELDNHPTLRLDAIGAFLRAIGFDVTIDETHVNARCDKESVLDLGTLCERADALFRLAPYLMDLDWTIGSLDLDVAAQSIVARSWAESFDNWGTLPLNQLLTGDRKGVLIGVEAGATGEREIAWSGEGPLWDRFNPRPTPEFLERFRESLRGLGVEVPPVPEEYGRRQIGQVEFERGFLNPLRAAVARGQVVLSPTGLQQSRPDVFLIEHEVERFAEILSAGEEMAAPLVRLARAAASLERTLDFRITGHVAGRAVERARLALLGDELWIYVLRDDQGSARLSFYSKGDILFRSREDPHTRWSSNACSDTVAFVAILRLNNYLAEGPEISQAEARTAARNILDELAAGALPVEPGPLPGERLLTGLRASPGRVVGPVVFGTQGRLPRDLAGAVLVSPSVSPDDTAFLYHAGGVVSTGGGVLSHAGLMAIQFHKPALIIPGRWRTEEDGSRTLCYRVPEYREEEREVAGMSLSIRKQVREREHLMVEGDLVILNASRGTLRVLGHDREAFAVYDGLRNLGEAVARLEEATDDREVIALRGRRIQARHRLEKLFARVGDVVLARWAVREMLMGGLVPGVGGGRADRGVLLHVLLRNERVCDASRVFLKRTCADLDRRLAATTAAAETSIVNARFLIDGLQPRIDVLRLRDSVEEAAACVGSGTEVPEAAPTRTDHIDDLARSSLQRMRGRLLAEVTTRNADEPEVRHLVRQIERLDAVVGASDSDREEIERVGERLVLREEAALRSCADKIVLGPRDCGLELIQVVGSKAANLGEIERLAGRDLVPRWFVVTDRAFRLVLEHPPGSRSIAGDGPDTGPRTLRGAIDAVLDRADLDYSEKSARIRTLWESAVLPDELVAEVLAAYRGLESTGVGDQPEEKDGAPFVALRSSAREEDTETAAGAGQFDTFLFVSGSSSVVEHLKRTWGGLWTERAIHNRAILGNTGMVGGGVVIQRIVWSRVSGVLLTVNVGRRNLQEIQINAGLGLGEGIVSGQVAADQITVSKEGDLSSGELRFNYVTADKRECIVFNSRAGTGTVRTVTLYHQRLRPALEYVELCELVRVACRLEAAYGYPLDIEFAIEGSRLWILQARPVVTFLAAIRETIESYPLAAKGDRLRSARSWEVRP